MGLFKDQTGSVGDRTCLPTAIGYASAAALAATAAAHLISHLAGRA